MHGHGRLGFSLALFSALSATMVFGQSAAFQLNGDAAVATPLQDDANLHDVQFVGQKIGWAAGDRGTVWKTDDGGAKWEFVKTPVDCSLRSVCFLTNRVGWIVGGGTTPYTKLGFGVVLFTNDGGRTWEQPSNASLPRLHYVKFFDLTRGEKAIGIAEVTEDYAFGLEGVDGVPCRGAVGDVARRADALDAYAGSLVLAGAVDDDHLVISRCDVRGRVVRSVRADGDHAGLRVLRRYA